MTRFALALLAVCAVGCERDPAPEPEIAQPSEAELDPGAIRVAIVDGLESAVLDPGVAQQLDLITRLDAPEVEAASERLLARATADAELSSIADAFFLALQDSEAMRAALLEYVRQNPELIDSDLVALRETFVADVERRLTREELARLLERQLRATLRNSNEALAHAWISEAGGASALAAAALARVEDPEFRAKLTEWLGREGLQSVLVRRFEDPKRAAQLLLGLAPTLLSLEDLVAILDHERTAKLLAVALGRALQDEPVRLRCEKLFELALATEFDTVAFTQELSRLFDEPTLSNEATSLLNAVAREPIARAVVEREITAISKTSQFDALLLQTLD